MPRRKHANDRRFVNRLIDADEAAFEEFTNGHLPQLYRFAQRRLDGDGDLARDIVQSTLCKAFPKLSTYRGDASFMTWLCACCRNEIAAHFRRKQGSTNEVTFSEWEIDVESIASSSRGEGPDERLQRGERAALVHDALDSLPPRYGRALSWKYLDELSVIQIAARLDVGPKAAESLLTRARQAFRDAYARLDRQEPRSAGSAAPTNQKMVLEP
jgi:RNA polymerase sigma-70 factor (ECF subfamily)